MYMRTSFWRSIFGLVFVLKELLNKPLFFAVVMNLIMYKESESLTGTDCLKGASATIHITSQIHVLLLRITGLITCII